MSEDECNYLEKKPCGLCRFEEYEGKDYCSGKGCGRALSPDAKKLAYDLQETKKVLLYPVIGDYDE